MPNVKTQSSNEIQNPKWKTDDPQFSYHREKYFDIESFEPHLTFACLPQAEILKFGFG
jgi:hypothetical protein